MAAKAEVLPRNKLSVWERTTMILNLVPLPIVLTWALVKSPFTDYGRSKSWKRIVIDRVTLWVVSHFNRRQTRAFFGEASTTYSAYMKSKNIEPVIDDLGEDATLFWLGPKRTDRVILYVHGGAFLFGPIESAPSYWSFVQEQLEKRGKPTAIALATYTLVPDAYFPVQIKQVVLAIQHLIKSGIKPENIQLAGDSAGANILHGVISHVLHPIEGVPKLTLSAPLAGVYMMSPWATMGDDEIIYTNQHIGDMLDVPTGLYWAGKVLGPLPASALPYLNANGAPPNWLEGVDKVVKRVLISVGGAEVLRDAVILYSKTFEKHHKDTTFFLQDNGIHIDPMLSFLVGDKDLGKLTPFVLDWLDKGLS
ncbi:hypothetical protein GALMADRAFT_245442 [Galerina marginata CBS 339.88]|uniref:Alpha/beta hydrolase fold-3 domain-containing protein n=1 Tax=Galerina marginata (strain CBS 339.88) TaxID=685588 RepID=A0A067TH61_GALM3|nr:hypothetical protein GALMADRAFT_245442 [Galerina marginata CBS 339.88]